MAESMVKWSDVEELFDRYRRGDLSSGDLYDFLKQRRIELEPSQAIEIRRDCSTCVDGDPYAAFGRRGRLGRCAADRYLECVVETAADEPQYFKLWRGRNLCPSCHGESARRRRDVCPNCDDGFERRERRCLK